MSRILLLGCGKLASQLPALCAFEFIGARRTAVTLEGITMHACDLSDADDIDRLLDAAGEIDAIVFSATPQERSEAAYTQTYVTIPQLVLERLALRNQKPFWLHVSSTGVFQHKSGEYVHESTVPAPQTLFAQLLLQSEQAIQAYGYGAIIRMGGLYGQGRTHLLNSIKAGRQFQTNPVTYTNRIHREDAARAIAFVLKRGLTLDKTGVEIFHGVDHDPAPLHEVGAYLAKLHGLPAPKTFEAKGLKAVGQQNKRAGNRKLVEAGFTFRYPSYRAGFSLD